MPGLTLSAKTTRDVSGSLFIRIAMHVTGSRSATAEAAAVRMLSMLMRECTARDSLYTLTVASAIAARTCSPRG